jgi:hypothetical protein
MISKLLLWLHALVRRFHMFIFCLWIVGLIALAPLCLLPGTAPPIGVGGVDLGFDKMFHLIAYGGLAGLASLLFDDASRRGTALLVVFVAALGYEIGQLWVPGRDFGWDDLSANIVGFGMGASAGWWIRRQPLVVAPALS